MNRALGLLVVSAAAFLAGCDATDPTGPPTIRLGRDECAECGMIVNEDRCSGALIVDSDGRPEARVFDDLGCLLDHMDSHWRTGSRAVYVHDHDSGRWLAAGAARFLVGVPDRIRTPMGSGMVAFETSESAEREKSRSGGETTGFEQLVQIRRSWREARRSPVSGNH